MRQIYHLIILVLCGLVPSWVSAATQTETGEARFSQILVTDQAGNPLSSAVVQIYPLTGEHVETDRHDKINDGDTIKRYEMAQNAQQFKPAVLVVPVNAEIAFPNRDRVSHHVYSFSPAKQFELELYKGDVHAPLTFNQAGIVTIGCNIHDKMKAHIVVTDSLWYGVTDLSGSLVVELPEQVARVSVWHPRQLQEYEAELSFARGSQEKIQVAVKKAERIRRGLSSWTKAST